MNLLMLMNAVKDPIAFLEKNRALAVAALHEDRGLRDTLRSILDEAAQGEATVEPPA